MADQIFWYVSRSAGLISWMAAAGAILVGLLIPSRLLGRKPTIPWLTDLHRMFGAMASVFLLIHMAALWFDHFVAFRFDDLLIPFVAEVPGLSRLSLALGVIAAWMLAAVQLTSLVRDRLPDQLWRSVHFTSYVVLISGTLHAVMAGSDIANPIVASIGASTLTAVILATVVRVRRMRRRSRQKPMPVTTPTGPAAPPPQPAPAMRSGPIIANPVGTRPGVPPPVPGPRHRG